MSYNEADSEFLVTWNGELIDGENEIFGQRIGSDGSLLSDNFRISSQGPDSDENFDAVRPAVGHNTITNKYLIVWEGDRTAGEDEIYAQRLGHDGGKIGEVVRVSFQGPEADADYRAIWPAIRFNASANEYLVTWQAASHQGIQPREISFKGTMQTLEAFQPLISF